MEKTHSIRKLYKDKFSSALKNLFRFLLFIGFVTLLGLLWFFFLSVKWLLIGIVLGLTMLALTHIVFLETVIVTEVQLEAMCNNTLQMAFKIKNNGVTRNQAKIQQQGDNQKDSLKEDFLKTVWYSLQEALSDTGALFVKSFLWIKDLWLKMTAKACYPFLYVKDSANNCLQSQPLVQKQRFSFSKSDLLRIDTEYPLNAPGTYMLSYGLSCQPQSKFANRCDSDNKCDFDNRCDSEPTYPRLTFFTKSNLTSTQVANCHGE